jgi:hypothetical protein
MFGSCAKLGGVLGILLVTGGATSKILFSTPMGI